MGQKLIYLKARFILKVLFKQMHVMLTGELNLLHIFIDRNKFEAESNYKATKSEKKLQHFCFCKLSAVKTKQIIRVKGHTTVYLKSSHLRSLDKICRNSIQVLYYCTVECASYAKYNNGVHTARVQI